MWRGAVGTWCGSPLRGRWEAAAGFACLPCSVRNRLDPRPLEGVTPARRGVPPEEAGAARVRDSGPGGEVLSIPRVWRGLLVRHLS
jgi:hypothetical protein